MIVQFFKIKLPNNLKYNNIIKLPNKIYFVECYCHHEAHELLWMGMYIFYQTIYKQRCCYWQEFLGLESKHNYSYSYPFTPTLLDIFPKMTFKISCHYPFWNKIKIICICYHKNIKIKLPKMGEDQFPLECCANVANVSNFLSEK